MTSRERLVDPWDAVTRTFRGESACEERDVERLRDLVARGDPWSRDLSLHATASALVVHPNGADVLVRWHPRRSQWMQVGGHGDPGEDDPWEVALREAREETGLGDLHALTPLWLARPIQVVIVPVGPRRGEPAHEHADVRYVLTTDRPDDAQAEHASAPIRWVSFGDAQDVVADEDCASSCAVSVTVFRDQGPNRWRAVRSKRREEPMTTSFGWDKLEKLEASIAWRRELDNQALANVWHLETVSDLAAELRRRMLQSELDARLIAVLWGRVPGDERDDVVAELQAPGTRFPTAASRLVEIVNERP